MNPSQYEIQREVETLRDIRRRSTAGGPGALVLDPDLPNTTPHSSPQHKYWDANNDSSDDSSGSSHSDGADPGDPSSLFWVPARLHPEIAPAEFREFIKEHARNPGDGSSSLDRADSSGGGLGRTKSMLKREYKPRANDGVENENNVVPVRRNNSRMFSNPGPQLTISDLQRLDELAEEASQSDDPSKLRSVLRRSLSLNVSPSAIEQMDHMPDFGDDADVPIIIPRPGQELRRTARTKIRKVGQTPGSHTFNTRSRRVSNGRSTTMDSSDRSSSDHGVPKISFDGPFTEEPASVRPESYSEEAFIYDSYVREEPEEIDAAPILVTSSQSTPSLQKLPEFEFEGSISPPQIHQPIPQQPYLAPAPPPVAASRTPSPEAPIDETVQSPQRSPEAASIQHPSSPSPSENSRKEKDKKGLFGKYKGGKKGAKEKEQREKEKEKESASFFGSLFGGKKKQEDFATNGLGHNSGRETAAALLGASKSSKGTRSPSPAPVGPGGPYARYPIHVERAIYRLSHIKLANPRRPLYEQVLISNLMFWYLGVINKTQNGGNGQQVQEGNNASNTNAEKEHRERKEQEERENAEREKMEREREKEREKEAKKESKRGTLNKSSAAGNSGSRKAEMPVRGPQYEMQHRVMEQEYSYPPNSGRVPPGPAQHHSSPPSLVQPQPQQANNYYYSGNPPAGRPRDQSPSRSGSAPLPPGAMPPVSGDQQWSSSPSHRSASTSPPPTPPGGYSNDKPRRSRSPPGQNRYTPVLEKHAVGHKAPTRSISANALVPNQQNGNLRKGTSAHAVMVTPSGRQSNDEDVPLALWQQQRRR